MKREKISFGHLYVTKEALEDIRSGSKPEGSKPTFTFWDTQYDMYNVEDRKKVFDIIYKIDAYSRAETSKVK